MRYPVIGAAMLLGGCVANPTVRYAEANSPEAVAEAAPHLIDSFYMQQSGVMLGFRSAGASGKDSPPGLVVTVARQQDERHRLMLLRGDKLWTRTTISLAKVENTDLIESAGVEVEDRRVALIQNFAGAVRTASLLLGASPGFSEPIYLKDCSGFPDQDCTLEQPGELHIPREGGEAVAPRGSLKVRWSAVPQSAVSAASFYASLGSRPANGLYYSACRDLDISYAEDGGTGDYGQPVQRIHSWHGRIADPDWIEFVAFPRKGGIRMHSQCGVSVTSERDPTRPADEVLGALIEQAIATKNSVSGGH